jgi:hypothetical protein
MSLESGAGLLSSILHLALCELGLPTGNNDLEGRDHLLSILSIYMAYGMGASHKIRAQ